MKKKLISAIIIIVMAILTITPVFAIVSPDYSFYINDYHEVLSSPVRSAVRTANVFLEENCKGSQIVVVVLEHLESLSANEYASDVIDQWGVGDPDENNGMALVLAFGDNEYGLAVGEGISHAFTDTMVKNYLDKFFLVSFNEGNYDNAINNLLLPLVEWYQEYYHDIITTEINKERIDADYWRERITNSPDDSSHYYRWYESLLFYIFTAVILDTIIYLVTSSIQSIRYFHKYYNDTDEEKPKFRIYHIWKGPHLYHDSKNGFGGGVFIIVLLVLCCIILFGGGGKSIRIIGSGRGGGGRSGGGGGGHR